MAGEPGVNYEGANVTTAATVEKNATTAKKVGVGTGRTSTSGFQTEARKGER
jgi:hypothetical protein